MFSLENIAPILDPMTGHFMQFLCCCYEKQRKTAAEQRQIPLFFRSPSRRKPRISAENAMSFADKFPAKQQKQREPALALRLRLV
jgi:hypothetical protein